MGVTTKKLEAIEQLLQIESEESLTRINEFIKTEFQTYPFSDAHKEVLEARLQEHKLNPEEGVSWGELKKEIKQSF